MTIVRLNKQTPETPQKPRRAPVRYARRPRITASPALRKELVFGLLIAAFILAITVMSAFNGGFSLEAGKLQMTLDASFSEGLRLSFVSL